MFCNEVIWNATDEMFVCEHRAFVEHTHATFEPYMRPMLTSEVIYTDDYECVFVDAPLTLSGVRIA